MLFWEKSTSTDIPLIDKPLDQSRLPSRFAQGRDLFAEPDSEDEALGLIELEDNRNAGIRAPELNPVDHSPGGLGSLSTVKKDFSGRQHGDLPDLDLDHHLQYHTDVRGDARYYTQSQLRPGSGFSKLDVEDGYGRGYRNATRFINFSVGAGHAGFAIKLNASGRISNTMLGSGSGFVADAFTTIDCPQGTDPVADSVTDTLQFLEGSNLVSITGDSAADSVTFDVVQANIDHDALTNFVANEHIDHSAVSVIAGTGLSGGGTIDSDRTINLNASLSHLTDVSIGSPLTGHVLVFDDGVQQFKNKALVGDVNMDQDGVVTIQPDAVTYDKMQDVSVADRLLGSISGGTVEEITLTSVGRNLLAAATPANQRTVLGLGSLATENTPLVLEKGGTGQTTQQAAIDALSAVSGATNEHVLTKDTATGNAVFKAPAGGGLGDVSAAANLTDNAIVRGDGGAKGVQTSGVLIDDSDSVTIPRAGTAKAVTSFLTLENEQNAADMDGTGTAVLFRQHTSASVAVDSARIAAVAETDWTGTASTQDAKMVLSTTKDGTLTDRVELSSEGRLTVGPVPPGISATWNMLVTKEGGGSLVLACINYSSVSASNKVVSFLERARGSAASPSAVQNNDQLGAFAGGGYDGSVFRSPGRVQFEIDGAVSAGVVPVNILFNTGTTGVGTTRLRVDSGGEVHIVTSDLMLDAGDLVFKIGASTFIRESSGNLGFFTDGVKRLDILSTGRMLISSGNFELSAAGATLAFEASGTHKIWKDGDDLNYWGTNHVFGRNSGNVNVFVNGSLSVKDGMAAPSTMSGRATLYVDSADGDLKVKFADGTVKTIVTDT